MIHLFRLYRSGYSDELPWDDNQLWAAGELALPIDQPCHIDLCPEYGSAASWYRVQLNPEPSPETNWVSVTATLMIDTRRMGRLPLSWYTGSPADWPSGLARFPDTFPPQNPGEPYGDGNSRNRGVWTLAVFRSR